MTDFDSRADLVLYIEDLLGSWGYPELVDAIIKRQAWDQFTRKDTIEKFDMLYLASLVEKDL